jgi:hypothetical protein
LTAFAYPYTIATWSLRARIPPHNPQHPNTVVGAATALPTCRTVISRCLNYKRGHVPLCRPIPRCRDRMHAERHLPSIFLHTTTTLPLHGPAKSRRAVAAASVVSSASPGFKDLRPLSNMQDRPEAGGSGNPCDQRHQKGRKRAEPGACVQLHRVWLAAL